MQELLLVIVVIALLVSFSGGNKTQNTYYPVYWDTHTDKTRPSIRPDKMWRRHPAEELSGRDIEQLLHNEGGKW